MLDEDRLAATISTKLLKLDVDEVADAVSAMLPKVRVSDPRSWLGVAAEQMGEKVPKEQGRTSMRTR